MYRAFMRCFLLVAMITTISNETLAQIMQWQTVAKLRYARHWHSSQVLQDGRILVIGGTTAATRFIDGAGTDGYCVSSCEVYDPATRQVQDAAPMTVAHSHCPSLIAQDGSVLVFGGLTGESPRGENTDLIERYDPATNTWAIVGRMSSPRRLHAAAWLDDERILLCGGALTNLTTVATTEIFNVSTGQTTIVGRMPQALKEGLLVNMPGMGIAYVGGRSGGPNSPRQTELIVFDGATETWQVSGVPYKLPMITDAVVLDAGAVIACGGSEAEQPAHWSKGVFRINSNAIDRFLEMGEGRSLHALHPIGDATVLVSGGLRPDLTTMAATLLIDAEYEVILQQPDHVTPRALHTIERTLDPVQGLTLYAISGLTDNATLTETIEMLVVESQDQLRRVSSIEDGQRGAQYVTPETLLSELFDGLQSHGGRLMVVNAIGQRVAELTAKDSDSRYALTSLPNGPYFVTLVQNGKTTTRCMMISN